MKLKVIVGLSLAVFAISTLIIIIGGLSSGPSSDAEVSSDTATTATPVVTAAPTRTPTPTPAVTATATPVRTPVPTIAPTPVKTPVPTVAPKACGTAGGSCTTAQVATHNSKTSCWVIYNKSYYNVTAFIPNHPGGVGVFTSTTCGHDISSYLAGSSSSAGEKHRHSSTAFNILASYRVGPVS